MKTRIQSDPRDKELIVVGAIAIIRGLPISTHNTHRPTWSDGYTRNKIGYLNHQYADELAKETLELAGFYETGLTHEEQERRSNAAAKLLLSTLD